MDELQQMQQLIEEMRQRLHDTGKSRCFTDPEVVRSSQELNKMLNEYEQILKKSCKGEKGLERILKSSIVLTSVPHEEKENLARAKFSFVVCGKGRMCENTSIAVNNS